MKSKKRIRRLAALVLCLVISLPMFFPDTELAYASDNSQVLTEEQTEKTEENSSKDVGEVGVSKDSNSKGLETEPQGQPQEESNVPNTEKETVTEPETEEQGVIKQTDIKKEIDNSLSEIPKIEVADITVVNIVEAGIEDVNFAQAVYEAIISPMATFLDKKTLADYTDIETALNEFTGVIDASNRGITSIKGIRLLKSTDSINLSSNPENTNKNMITDISPLAAPGNRRYYGADKNNLDINISGNPLDTFASDLGGRLFFDPSLEEGETILDNQKYTFICGDNPGFSESGRVPIDIKMDGKIANLLDIKLEPSGDAEIGAKMADGEITEGAISGINIDNIKGTGKLLLKFALDELLRFYRDRDGTVAPQTPNPYFKLPIEIEMYTKLEKGNKAVEYNVQLSKYGKDDHQLKTGAKYSLYKKTGLDTVQLIEEDLVTDEDGSIRVTIGETGDYYFQEVTPPTGYMIPTGEDADKVEFTVSEGELLIKGGNGGSLKAEGDVEPQVIDGTYLLGGASGTPAKLEIKDPINSELESISLEWTAGNHGGSAGSVSIPIGTGADGDDVNYEANKAEAIRRAEEQIKECKELYQNVKISSSFVQKVEHVDPLKPVEVTINAEKNLAYPNGTGAGTPEDGKFTFRLKNAEGEPADRKPIDLTAANVGKQATFQFKIGDDINKDTPKDGDTYLYRYILTEESAVDSDEEYQYDKSTWEVTVPVVKETTGLRVKVDEILYKKENSTDRNSTAAKFTNIKRKIPLIFNKVSEDGTTLLKGAGFTLYVCNNTEDGHTHGEECTWDKDHEYRPEIKSGENGQIEFSEVPINAQYILVESTTPEGCKAPSEESFILVNIADIDGHGEVTMKGYGDFSNTNMKMVEKNGDIGLYHVKNIHYYDLSISKTVKGDVANLLKEFHFIITLEDPKGNPVNGTYSYQGAATAEAVAPADGSLTFVNGKASITLKHGQSIRIEDILAYSKYEVEEQEANTDGYTTTSENGSKKITGDITASFVNEKYSNPITGLFDLYGTGMSAIFITILGIGVAAFLLHRRRKHS